MRWLVVLLAIVACKKHEDPAATGSAVRGPPALAQKESFRIDVGPQTPCTAGAPCETRLVLTALGEFHVNDKFPTKLVPDPTPGVELQPAAFALDSATVGTLTLPYRAAKRGTHKVSGTFELGVCTGQHCVVEKPHLTFDVLAN